MKISVVIAALNEIETIEECLKSIKNQTHKDFDIIVVDGYSKDGTYEKAKKYAKVYQMNATGPGPARNCGVKKSNADIIAFTDADCIVPETWLETIAGDFDDKELLGVGGVFKPLNPRLLDRVMYKLNSDWIYRLSAFFRFYQFGTPNCAYRRDAFLDAGGFDENLSMFEDTDLSIRMSKRGKVRFDKKLYVYNSVRRFQQRGYFSVFMKYMGVYFNYFTGKGVKTDHFATIRHKERMLSDK